jgi:hypothetical protein
MSQLTSNRIRPFEKAARHSEQKSTTKWPLSIISRRDPFVVLCFCAIGLVLTFAALAELIDFSSLIEEIGLLY